MTQGRSVAQSPEELTRLFVERANAGDAIGLAHLYEPDAVVAYPPGRITKGRPAILAMCQVMVDKVTHFEAEDPVLTLRQGEIALTSTRRRDGQGLRLQVVRQQPDGSWLRVLDWPEPPAS